MELRQLRHFLALADMGSFSRAAQRLCITQSALSRSIQALESQLDGALFDRIGKRNELTPMGLAVMDYARRIVQEADDLRTQLPKLRKGRLGALRVGLGSGPGALLMRPLLMHMAQHESGVPTEIVRGATELQLLQLRSRQLDALIIDVRRVVPATDLRIEHLSQMRTAFICRTGHPLLQALKKKNARKTLAFASLLAYPIASIPLSDEVARLLIDQFGAQANPRQLISLCCEEIASLIETVRHTDAIFLGICAAARQGLASGDLVELPLEPALQAPARFALITLAGRTENASVGFLRQFVGQYLRD